MANLINSVNKGYTVANAGLKQDEVQATLEKTKQVAADSFESNSAVKTMSGATSTDGLIGVLQVYPFLFLADKAVEAGMSKKGANGLLAKAASLGDKISNTFHLERFLSLKHAEKVSNFLKNNTFTKYFTKDYKAIAKSSMAKSKNLTQELIEQQTPQLIMENITDLKHNYHFATALKNGTVSLSDDILKIMDNVGNLKQPVSQQYLKEVSNMLDEMLTKLLGKTDLKVPSSLDEVSKKCIRATKAVYIPNNEEIQSLVWLKNKIDNILSGKETLNSSKQISELLCQNLSILKKLHPEFSVISKNGISQKASETLFNSTLSNTDDVVATLSKEKVSAIADELISKGLGNGKLTGINNKLKASKLKTGNTLLGQLFAKGALKTKNILTYGGGAISLIFAAQAFSQAIKATKEAPKGEKKATFMHVMSEQYLGMILFQPSIALLYNTGGNKYRGMTPEGRQAFTELVNNVNKTVDSAEIAKIQQKLLRKGADVNGVKSMTGKSLAEAKKIASELDGGNVLVKALSFINAPIKTINKMLHQKDGISDLAKDTIAEIAKQSKTNQPIIKETAKVAKLQSELLLKGVDKDKVATLAGKSIKEAKKLAKSMKGDGANLKFWEKPLKFAGKILDVGLDSIKSPTKLGKAGGKIRGFAGGFARFALIMFIIQPFIQKPVTKLCHKIFGEPKTYLAKQQTEEGKKGKKSKKVKGEAPSTTQNTTNTQQTSTNLLDLWRNKQAADSQKSVAVNAKPQIATPQQNVVQNTKQQSVNTQQNTISASQIAQNTQEAIPAKKISDTQKTERYIPSIEVSFSDDQAELDKQAEIILKSTDSIMNAAGKFL